jgi:hypothetical protein
MANSNVAMYVQTVQGWPLAIANSDGQTLKTILTAGVNGSRLESLIVASTDTAARDLQFSILRSSVNYIIGTVNIPLSSGNINSAPTVNILGAGQLPGLAYDAKGNPYMDLKAGDVLQVEALTTVTSGKTISVYGSGGDF